MVMNNMNVNVSISGSSSFANVSSSASSLGYSFVFPIESFKDAKNQVTDSDIEYVVDRYSEALKLLSE